MRKINYNGSFFTQPSEIMGKIKSYFNDKYDRKTKTTSNDCEQFLKTVDMPRLTPEETEKIDKPITKKDIYDCLQDMENDKSPGNDGLPKEFYITFFDLIVDNLIQCYNCCFEEGELYPCHTIAYDTSICQRLNKISHTLVHADKR